MKKHRCTKGHDKCGEMYAGPECPLCEVVPPHSFYAAQRYAEKWNNEALLAEYRDTVEYLAEGHTFSAHQRRAERDAMEKEILRRMRTA